MDATTLLVFAVALLVAAGSPGPSIAALVARVLARGWRDVLPFLAAMWLGEAVWLAAALAGLATVAERFHLLFLAIKYAGVVYLLWLAWQMWRAPVADAEPLPPARRGGWRLFAAGLSVTLGNPKIMVFYLALLPTIVGLHGVGVGDWAWLTAVMLGVLVSVDVAWVALAEHARRLLASERARRLVNRIGAGVMGGAAVAIASR